MAKLTQKQHFQPANKQDYYVYSLETSRTLRGEAGKSFRVWEENTSGRASFRWSVGKTYLLFLNPTDDGMWWLYGCGNSAPIDEAASTFDVIGALQNRQGGVIQVLVTDGGRYPPSGNLSGITVKLESEKNEYSGITNRKGKVMIHVPAGHYTVAVAQPGRVFKKDFESYEDPDSVTIVDGGGAQIQFDRQLNH